MFLITKHQQAKHATTGMAHIFWICQHPQIKQLECQLQPNCNPTEELSDWMEGSLGRKMHPFSCCCVSSSTQHVYTFYDVMAFVSGQVFCGGFLRGLSMSQVFLLLFFFVFVCLLLGCNRCLNRGQLPSWVMACRHKSRNQCLSRGQLPRWVMACRH